MTFWLNTAAERVQSKHMFKYALNIQGLRQKMVGSNLKKKLTALSENINILLPCAVRTTMLRTWALLQLSWRMCLLSHVCILSLLCSSAGMLSPWQPCRPMHTGWHSSTVKFITRTQSSSSRSSPPLWRLLHPSSAQRYLCQFWAEGRLPLEPETLKGHSCCVRLFNGLLSTMLFLLM